MRPAVGCSKSRISLDVVVLPQPDSPTRLTVSPGFLMSKDTPSTARTYPRGGDQGRERRNDALSSCSIPTWPRLPCRGTCFRKSCGGSMNCDEDQLRCRPRKSTAVYKTMGEVRLDDEQRGKMGFRIRPNYQYWTVRRLQRESYSKGDAIFVLSEWIRRLSGKGLSPMFREPNMLERSQCCGSCGAFSSSAFSAVRMNR